MANSNTAINRHKAQQLLKDWYLKNKRSLPWREDNNPYLIWISEVMLQQTTVQAVIPYFKRFKERFPNLQALASSPLEDVIAQWAGLGYYSRARNLHKSAQILAKRPHFPRTAVELLELPGFGDYTARAVSSIAFDESVGVVDGNVIRILSRLYGTPFQWWNRVEKLQLQHLADQMTLGESASIINQAMMELGATVCTPSSPACGLCPWLKICSGHKSGTIDQLPAKKPRKEKELYLLEMLLIRCGDEIALKHDHSLPFLKKAPLPPIAAKRIQKKPQEIHFQHSITHHQIFVKVTSKTVRSKSRDFSWCPIEELPQVNPSSLLKKALQVHKKP